MSDPNYQFKKKQEDSIHLEDNLMENEDLSPQEFNFQNCIDSLTPIVKTLDNQKSIKSNKIQNIINSHLRINKFVDPFEITDHLENQNHTNNAFYLYSGLSSKQNKDYATAKQRNKKIQKNKQQNNQKTNKKVNNLINNLLSSNVNKNEPQSVDLMKYYTQDYEQYDRLKKSSQVTHFAIDHQQNSNEEIINRTVKKEKKPEKGMDRHVTPQKTYNNSQKNNASQQQQSGGMNLLLHNIEIPILGNQSTLNKSISKNNLSQDNDNDHSNNEKEQNQQQQSNLLLPISYKTKCNCSKSKCLKRYCECFAKNAYCTSECECIDCENFPENETKRNELMKKTTQRDQNAFKPKVQLIEQEDYLNIPKTTRRSAQQQHHSHNVSNSPKGIVETNQNDLLQLQSKFVALKGCNCKKSNCRKKYCECYEQGLACTENCNCIGCKNHEDSEQIQKKLTQLNQQKIQEKECNKSEKHVHSHHSFKEKCSQKHQMHQKIMQNVETRIKEESIEDEEKDEEELNKQKQQYSSSNQLSYQFSSLEFSQQYSFSEQQQKQQQQQYQAPVQRNMMKAKIEIGNNFIENSNQIRKQFQQFNNGRNNLLKH